MLKFVGVFLLFFAPALLAQTSTVTKRTPAIRATDGGMQEAIRFERQKESADALQARKERLHPTAYDYSTDRSDNGTGTVKDSGSLQYRRDHVSH